jgi:hypothetical protein
VILIVVLILIESFQKVIGASFQWPFLKVTIVHPKCRHTLPRHMTFIEAGNIWICTRVFIEHISVSEHPWITLFGKLRKQLIPHCLLPSAVLRVIYYIGDAGRVRLIVVHLFKGTFSKSPVTRSVAMRYMLGASFCVIMSLIELPKLGHLKS